MNDESKPAESASGGVTPLASNLQAGKFLTVAEVAAILRLSKMSVYRLIHSGQLEAVQFGRSFRVTEKALNTYLDNAYFSAGCPLRLAKLKPELPSTWPERVLGQDVHATGA